MYHWACALGGAGWGWWCALLNIIGLVTEVAGINYSCAQFVLPFFRIPATNANLYLMFAFILITQGLLNQFRVRLIAILNDLSVAVHMVGLAVLVIAIFWMAPLQPIAFLAKAVNSNGRSPYFWAFLLGLLQAHWTYTGFDASAHMAEETDDPRRRAPWGIVLSVAVSGVAGYVLLIALTLAVRDIGAVLAAKDANGNPIPTAVAILQFALGARSGNALAALASIAMWFCGLACITSASRAVFSLARDHGMPAANWFRKVDPRHRNSGQRDLGNGGIGVGCDGMERGDPDRHVAQHDCALRGVHCPGRTGAAGALDQPEWTRAAVWSLGKYGAWLNAIAVAYTAGITIILVMPPNELAGKTMLGLLAALAAIYYFGVRRIYRGPAWTKR